MAAPSDSDELPCKPYSLRSQGFAIELSCVPGAELTYMNKLVNLCGKFNICVSKFQIEKFEILYNMLAERNSVVNLTAITDKDDVIIKHFVDSLSVLPMLCKIYEVNDISKLPKGLKIIDVGTGAGFPGLPLKIMLPDCEFVLLDSVGKKLKFIDDVIDELKLENIRTIHGRAEDVASDKKYREQFDLCVSRAVANLSTLAEYCIPFVKKDGYFISYKSGESEDEINASKGAIKLLGGKIQTVQDFVLPDTDNERKLVCIKKLDITNSKYPRKAGIPGKSPLK